MSQSPAMTVSDRVAEVAPGDEIRADGWNILARLANGQMRGVWRNGKPGPATVRQASPGLTVWVRNDTGGDLPAFVPVKMGATLTGLVATPDPLPYVSRDYPLFEGQECDGDGVNVVTQEAIPEDEIGRAVVMGVTVARVASGLVAGDSCQPPGSGNVELVAGGAFATLISSPYGSGDKSSLVLIGGGGGCDPNQVDITVYQYACVDGDLVETPYTYTLEACGLADVSV